MQKRKFIATGSGINLKTGKKIDFKVPENISKKGLESLTKNVCFEDFSATCQLPNEKLMELWNHLNPRLVEAGKLLDPHSFELPPDIGKRIAKLSVFGEKSIPPLELDLDIGHRFAPYDFQLIRKVMKSGKRQFTLEGEGINLKTGKPISFKVPEGISERGKELIAENIRIRRVFRIMTEEVADYLLRNNSRRAEKDHKE